MKLGKSFAVRKLAKGAYAITAYGVRDNSAREVMPDLTRELRQAVKQYREDQSEAKERRDRDGG